MSYDPNQGPRQDLVPPPPAYTAAGTAVYYAAPLVFGHPPSPSQRPFYPRTTSVCLGVAQLFMAAVSLTGGIMALVYDASMAHTGVGIWCGIFYVIAGSLALAAGSNPTNSLVTSTAVTSGLNIAFGITEVTIAAIGVSNYVFCYDYECTEWYDYEQAAVAANCLLIGAGSWQVIFGMWLLAVSCHAVHSRSNSQVAAAASAVPVTYVTGPSGAVLLPMHYQQQQQQPLQDYYHQTPYAAGTSNHPQAMFHPQNHQT